MSNIIKGIKYHSGFSKLKSEQELLKVFEELRGVYEEINTRFKITDNNAEPVRSLRRFLQVAVSDSPYIFIRGSGEFAGLSFKDAEVEYNLKDVHRLTKYWDIHTRRECDNCVNCIYEWLSEDYRESRCSKIKGLHSAQTCKDNFSPEIQGSDCKAPRNLEKMIELAS